MTTLSIIILNYNTKELTSKCVNSIAKQYKKEIENGAFEIIVADNASQDGSVEAIRNLPCPLVILENKENYGFSKGNNIGAKQAKGKYILFLNSDTLVGDKGLLDMVEFLEKHKEIGILGGKLRNEDGSSQPSGGKFYNVTNVFFALFGFERLGMLRESPRELTPIDWVSGGSLMIKKELFEKLSGFDEHFFMYMEDMELCLRAKKMGFRTYFFPDVSIVHKELGSSNRTFAILHIYKGLLYFYRKHSNYMQYIFVKLLLMVKALLAMIIGICTYNRYLMSTYRKAFALTLHE